MRALVGEVTHWFIAKSTRGKGFVTHGASLLLEERVGLGFAVAFEVPKSLGVAEFGVGLESKVEIAA